MNAQTNRKQLIHILQMAYSGEKAAALAYAGHWRAVRKAEERKAIWQIEQDEWEHRALILPMLHALGAKPQAWREIMMGTIGSVIFLACFISGWFFPMYFAGRLEHANVHEYVDAAEMAKAIQHSDYEAILLKLSLVEQSHEDYFKERVTGHCLTPLMKQLFHWGPESQIVTSTVDI